ncbi:MAG: DUF2169 domain-containing protein [Bradymonadia bacterium]
MQLPGPNPEFPRHFVNHDGYQAQYLPQNGEEGKLEAFYFVVKRSYDLTPGKATPAIMQRPLYTSDRYYDTGLDPLRTPMRYETDLMPPKVACDVIVNGHCYAPGGEAVQAICSVQVGDNAPKRVRVIGDRSVWQPRGTRRAAITAARPFSVMPLRWDYAYGGVDQQCDTGLGIYPANPSGVGFWAQATPDEEGNIGPSPDHYGAMPNLEHPDIPIELDHMFHDPASWKKAPPPWSMGWVPKHWEPRASRAGIDPKVRPMWDLFSKSPLLKKFNVDLPVREMDPRFFNGAPHGQVIPFPVGGELVVLENMHPTEHQLRFRLPAEHPRMRWSLGGDAPLTPVSLKIDTITIEPDLMAMDVCWRGRLPVPTGMSIAKMKHAPIIEIDGELTAPAQLLDSGFPMELITEGKP